MEGLEKDLETGSNIVSESEELPKDQEVVPTYDLNDPQLYFNRELTWLNFNQRVLHEADDARNPLLERVRFSAIVCANLDEFFMKRIGGLKQQLGAGITGLSVDGRSPSEQIEACHYFIREIESRKQEVFDCLVAQLAKEDIFLIGYDQLLKGERRDLREEFQKNIFPLITPQVMDPAHPFPFISNLAINLLVTLEPHDHRTQFLARIKVPVGPDVPRFIKLENGYRFVKLEDVVSANLDLLFPKMKIVTTEMFRVTRNAVTEMDEEQADDLLAMIEKELRYRKFASIVRLQVSPGMDPAHRGKLAAELGLDEAADVFEVKGMVGKTDLHEIANLDFPQLKFPVHYPIDPPRLKEKTSIFYNLRERGPILVVHPFESFSLSVERFLAEAAADPKVRGIKMTLYRTAKKSKVIDCLLDAARNGKQVTVVVELKARFDEAANIHWANQLEEAGIHVTYGVVGLKTHAKVILVVRRDYNGLRRYAHIGTGNYNAFTGGLYTDMGLFTCDEMICRDLSEFFNYLTTGFTPQRNYRKLITAPIDLKRVLIEKIQREMKHHRPEKPGRIIFKMNALEDPDVTKMLYRAGQAGVQVDLLVRDTCRLRPGLPGLSESIRVTSIIGRFLEHGRIYYFQNDGKEEVFIGSADSMKRNLESRVEVLTPVDHPILRKDLKKILMIQLSDCRGAWDMQSDGTYSLREPEENGKAISSQELLIEIAEKRAKEGRKLKKLKSKGMSKKEYWSAY